MRASSWPIGMILAAMLLAVPTGCVPPEPKTVSLRLQGGVPDATVTIDDMYLGSLKMVAHRGVALPPGKHRITVERPGYFPWDKVVEVSDGDPPVRLDVALQAIPD